MTQHIRLAVVEDAPTVLDLTLRAYEPIRELNIKFTAATADLQLVTNNIQRNATYVMAVLLLLSRSVIHGQIQNISVRTPLFGGLRWTQYTSRRELAQHYCLG